MKNALLKSVVFTALLSSSTITLAAAPSLMNGSMKVSGFYLGIQGGGTRMDLPDFADTIVIDEIPYQTTSASRDTLWSPAGRVYGGYLFGNNSARFGIEIGYMKSSNREYQLKDIETSEQIAKWNYESYSADLLAVLKFYINTNVNIYAKAGAVYAYQKFKFKSFDPATAIKINKTEHKVLPEVQIGIAYDLTRNWSTNLTYLHTFGRKPAKMKTVKTTTPKIDKKVYNRLASMDGVMLGVEYHLV